jgi:asparagine synthetase B (glutamine-hydrolysing)
VSAVRADPVAEVRAAELSRWERATGLAIGSDPSQGDQLLPRSQEHPRAALAAELVSALACSPCVVSFSGGRDSSAVLAAAVEVARREGLPDPVPVTLRFPGVATTDESEWQELVIRHLRVSEWERIVVRDELDLLGPVARAALTAHGLLWPPNAYVHVPILERAHGGCVITGFDGDGLFGYWRWAHAQSVLHRRVRPEPRDALRVGLALAPARVRLRWMRPDVVATTPWLRAEARAELAKHARADAAREPRTWDRRITYYRRRRYLRLTVRSLELLAAKRGVEVRHPLLAPTFLTALASDGGRAGYGDRTAAMRALFADVLPLDLLTRPRKAEFGRALWRSEARAFAESWDGTGVDDELVDPEGVRVAWSVPSPWFGANTLLHLAWLAAQCR